MTVPSTYADYADARDDPRFTDWLRARSEPAWTEATEHRFVAELADGTVADDVFRRYLVQDYAFVTTLAALVGHAAGEAPTVAGKRELAGFLRTLTDEEDDYFERSFDALSVPEADRTSPRKTATTEAFEDLLTRAAHEGGYAESLATLLAVEWVYCTWGVANADASPDPFYLVEWIDLHSVPAFESFVAWLRTELDREGPTLSPRREERVARHFRRAVDIEVAFFDAAYGR
ncbi:TenA family protein [Salinigranum rubrum]|uniref:TenA family protein n=1 Tax=Salinigranum rubrum TaxID=755307 RepID=UPI001FE29EC6|nr:TenA family protein [Salinigranum rubrum]